MTTLNTAPMSVEDARRLVSLIEAGDNQGAQEIIQAANQVSPEELFAEVGKLTRQLHDSLNNFQLDPKIANLTSEEIPDAQARLIYVIEATEEAANKTMDLVDSCMPIANKLQTGMQDILPEWGKLMERQLQLGEFNMLVERLDNFLKEGSVDAGKLSGLLTEVLMAQGYQDLTGQVIRRVIELVKEVEDSLVDMLTMFGAAEGKGSREVVEKPHKSEKQADIVKAEGPILDADSREDVASDQVDVDDLLSSLGF
jgi:chemotaxis protein CheZ